MESKPLAPPEELKFIAPFLDRARELKQREPVVAYWCQYYAAKLALAGGSKSKESQQYLAHLLDALEQEKKPLAGNEAVTNDTVAYARIENFALRIFLNADNEDRQGLATKKTAKTFLAASVFLDVLKTFGEVDSEVEEKIKYAKWKAMDIMKCLREGRKPAPGPPGGEQEQEEQQNQPPVGEPGGAGPDGVFPAPGYDQPHPAATAAPAAGDTLDMQNFPAAPTTPVVSPGQWQQNATTAAHLSDPPAFDQQQYRPPHCQQRQDPPTSQLPPTGPPPLSHIYGAPPVGWAAPYSPQPRSSKSASYPPPAPASYARPAAAPGGGMKPSYSSPSGFAAPSVPPPILDHTVIAVASKHARFVISALQYDDVKTAVENLRKALELLEPYNTG